MICITHEISKGPCSYTHMGVPVQSTGYLYLESRCALAP